MVEDIHDKSVGERIMHDIVGRLGYNMYVLYSFCPITGAIFGMVPTCRSLYIPEGRDEDVSTLKLVITRKWQPVYDADFNYIGYKSIGSDEVHTEWPKLWD